MTRADRARALFKEGYNCGQAVILAFEDLTGLDRPTLAKLASGLGGGMGRMREVCGTVSGMVLLAGLLYDRGQIPDPKEKAAHYERIQALANAFKAETGSIVCRELLSGVATTPGAAPEPRTEGYYARRPCGELCALSAEIFERYLEANPL